jgi:subtilisin family serine protease
MMRQRVGSLIGLLAVAARPRARGLAGSTVLLVGASVLSVGLALPDSAASVHGSRAGSVAARQRVTGSAPRQRTGPEVVMLQLAPKPAGAAYAAVIGAVPRAQRDSSVVRARATEATRAALGRVERAQQIVVRELGALHARVRVMYRVKNAYDGIAVLAPPSQMNALRRLRGVSALHLVPADSSDNASTVPLIGAPSVWQSAAALGDGMRVGIIDTGIDYIHTDFGGPGTGYATNNTTGLTGTIYPTAKVVGGYDFAGDAYDAGDSNHLVPTPDPNPMDCNGHGTHVAGTAAGFGVNADGTTYAGTYNTSTPFSSMRIGPGVAPHAVLYALRVFGCHGSTQLTTQAIDWALDPNNDGNLADHLDVVNMSLGSDFASADSPAAVASDQAAADGMIVVAAAGNSGDQYFATGAPADATRAISVASSVDSTEVMDGLDVTAPAAIAGTYPGRNSQNFDFSTHAPVSGTLAATTHNATGCSAFDATDTALITGKVALLYWNPLNAASAPCGSTVRVNNAAVAGAVGVILGDNTETISTGILGNSTIPSFITTASVASQLKTNVAGGVTVTLTSAHNNATKLVSTPRTDTLSTFSSRGPRSSDAQLKPDVTAPGDTVFSATNGTGTQGASLSGTSMASPHVAGSMALLRETHPSWSVEELKAALMNTATHDLYTGLNQSGTPYSPARVGAGRIDVPAAVGQQVIAYQDSDGDLTNAGDGSVSVSFGSLQVSSSFTVDKTIRVENLGPSAASYTVGYSATTSIPGVSYSFPDGPTVSSAAGGTSTFRVRLTVDPSAMRNSVDPTVSTANGRFWIPEASGDVTLTPASGPLLRVPVYVTARPASQMGTSETYLSLPSASGTTQLDLTGAGVNTGSSFPTDYVSTLTPFELQGRSPQIAALPRPSDAMADLRDIGVATNEPEVGAANGFLAFGVATYGDWMTPASQAQFTIYIDTNRDGTDDYVLYNSRFGGDFFGAVLKNLATNTLAPFYYYVNGFSGAGRPTAPFDSNVLAMPVPVSYLNMGAATRFNYHVVSFGGDGQIDQAGPFTYDFAHPGLDFTGGGAGMFGFNDLPGSSIPVSYDWNALLANHSFGALLLHHLNGSPQSRPQELIATSVSVADVSNAEGNSGSTDFAVVVARSGDLTRSATVDWATADGSATASSGDYAAASGTVSFASGQATATIHVAVNGDAIVEPDETFTVSLSNPNGTSIDWGTATGTIVNDDFAPAISSFSPPAGKVKTLVTISGSHFTGLLSVTFNGVAASSPTLLNDSTVTAKVPSGATSGPITVTTASGQAVSTTTFKVKPVLTSFSPPSGPVGTTVVITGTAFTGVKAVKFNGVKAHIVSSSYTQITATVPAGATTGLIVVTTPGGSAKSKTAFTVT